MTLAVESQIEVKKASRFEILEKFLRIELAPRPGRLQNVLRITALTILTVIVAETYRIPFVSYSAYIVFFGSKEEAASTIVTGLAAAFSVTVSIFLALGIYMLSAGEPGLRFPLMAIVVFAGMYISRASALGMIGFLIGFLVTVSLTLIDSIPPAAARSSGDLLTRSVLWLWVVVMIPVTFLSLGNIFGGRDPMELLRSEIADRIALIAKKLISRKVSDEPLQAPSEILAHLKVSTLFRPKLKGKVERYHRIIALVIRLDRLASELNESLGDPKLSDIAFQCGDVLKSAERFLRTQEKGIFIYKGDEPIRVPGTRSRIESTNKKDDIALVEISRLINDLASILASNEVSQKTNESPKKAHAHRGLLRPDALTNPDYVRHALKATLAIFTAYVTYNMLAWPGIVTCMVTCFFVSLGSFGETAHKMTLRLSGAVIGGALGLATVVFVMPYITTVTALCVLLAIVSIFAAWISTSSERLSYAGLQVAMAYFFSILVGYGPSVDLSQARDRVVGILLGNAIVFVIFSTLWPTSALIEARRQVGSALRALSNLLTLPGNVNADKQSDEQIIAAEESVIQALRLSALDPFESEKVKHDAQTEFDSRLPAAVRALFAPVFLRSVVFDRDAGAEAIFYENSLSSWLSDVSHQMEIGAPFSPRPRPGQDLLESINWYRELDRRVEILESLLQKPVNLKVDLKQLRQFPDKGAAEGVA